MGGYGSKQSDPKKSKGTDLSGIHKEYMSAYEECKKNPNFFDEYFSEVPMFAKNIKEYFPKVQQNFDSFFEMVMYLKRQQKNFKLNKHAVQTGPTTNLIDRYLIITLKLSLHDYDKKVVDLDEMDDILNQYFKIYVKEPEKGSVKKILRLLRKQNQKEVNVKAFIDDIREEFPSALRNLKDYYNLKFKKLEKQGHLLRKFKSRIVNNDAIILSLRLNRLTSPDLTCLYNTDDFGLSFISIEKQLIGYTGPWLLLIHHTEKDSQGQKQDYIFGSYQAGGVQDVQSYQGGLSSYLFTLHPQVHFYTTDKGDGDTKYFWFNTISNEKFGKRKGIGFGGNQDKKNFKLWIDEDIDYSTVYNGKDNTYGFGHFATFNTEKLHIKRLQFWGLGHQFDLDNHKKYWEQRQIEIMKRRKVDKKQLLSQNADLFFQKTFEHRGQVIGEIQKPEKEEKE